jgi:hypothetical protein
MSSNDWNNPPTPPETDGWVRPERNSRPVDFAEPRPAEPVLSEPGHYPLQRTRRSRESSQERDRFADSAKKGQTMAIFAHLSIVFGLPVFLIPMLQRNNAFALHHAKAAGTIFGIFFLCGLVAFLTCGLAVPLALLCYVPALVAITKAAKLEGAGTWGLGEMGERIFSGVEVKEEKD